MLWIAAASLAFGPSSARAQDAGASQAIPADAAAQEHARSVECMTLAVAYEAGYESVEGQQAVAEVVMNRARNPIFPKTVCGVVFAGSTRSTGCQFSFTCDGSLRRKLPARVMLAARAVAEQAIDGLAPSRVPGATHYHADYVTPYWSSSLVRLTKIGPHIFYRLPGVNSTVPIPGAVTLASTDPSAPSASGGKTAVPVAAPAVFAPWGLALASLAPRTP